MFIQILGTGVNHTKKIRPYLGKYRPSILVKEKNTVILVDVGSDIFKKISKEELKEVTHILITHAHTDAIKGIPRLNRFFATLNKDVPIYTIPHVIETIKLRYTSRSYDFFMFHSIGSKKVYKLGDIDVQPIRVFHIPGYPTVAFNFNKMFFYGADVGPFFSNYKTEHFSNNTLLLIDGTYWDKQSKLNNHVAVLENLQYLLGLNNQHIIFTGMGDSWIPFEEANKLLGTKLEEYKKEHTDTMVKEVRTAKEGEKLRIEENVLTKIYDPPTLIKKLDLTQKSYVVEPLISGKSEVIDDKDLGVIYERVVTLKGEKVITDILSYKKSELINKGLIYRVSFIYQDWLSQLESKKLPIRWVVKREKLFPFLRKLSKKYPKMIIRPATSKYYDGKFIVEFDKETVSKPAPEITENYIRWRIRDPELFVKESFRTIVLSESQGIKAIIGNFKSDPEGPTHVQSVLFDKSKWTVEKARKWIEDHKEQLKSVKIKLNLKTEDSKMDKDIRLPKDKTRPNLKEQMVEMVIGSDVFEQSRIEKAIPFYKLALYSKALLNLTKDKEFKIIDLKWEEQYVPASYEFLETKRDQKERLLVTGYILIKGETPLVIHFRPGFHCQLLTIYGRKKDQQYLDNVTVELDKYVKSNNPWKNEKITPFGKFLPLSKIDASQIVLDKEVIHRLTKTVFKFFESKDKYTSANLPFKRGVIFSGVPGTGKTLAGKIIMNNIDNVTFLWVTAKDFMHLDTSYLFDMARELQPSILFIEDVDRVLRGSTLDTVKTQMDGLEPNDGILTILSTNYPKQLPKTLIDRPGRFDDVISFSVPDIVSRFKILWMYSRTVPIKDKKKTLAKIAKISEGLTPSHLKEIIVSSYISSDGTELTFEDLKRSFDRLLALHDKFGFREDTKNLDGYPVILKSIRTSAIRKKNNK